MKYNGKCGHQVKKIKYYCIECKQCFNCCVCKKLTYYDAPLKFHTSKSTEKKFNSSDRYVAAEIEIAGAKSKNDDSIKAINSAVAKWPGTSVVFDGSLPLCGFEITTAPANGDKFVKQIEDITAGLKTFNPIITRACGLHIHVDARDFNFYDIVKLIKIYNEVEPLLFAMVPSHRRKSKYCLPCGAKYRQLIADKSYWHTKYQIVYNTYNQVDSDTLRKSKYNDARYNALNLHSWFYRGTIEFRLMEGSIDPAYITNWGILLAKLLDYVIQTSDADIEKLVSKRAIKKDTGKVDIKKYNKNINDLLCVIFNDFKDDDILLQFIREQLNKNKKGRK